MHLLECHNIRLLTRRAVLDMFNKDVMRQIVLAETSDDDDENDDDLESNPMTARPNMPM
jgi:hypothetical protein